MPAIPVAIIFTEVVPPFALFKRASIPITAYGKVFPKVEMWVPHFSPFWRSGAFPNFQSGRFIDRKSTRLNSSHVSISYAVFCLKKKMNQHDEFLVNDHHNLDL